MNWAHVHLVLTHLPVIGIFFGLAVSVYALLSRSSDVKKLGQLILVFVAAIAIPVYLTGEPAEEMVEQFAGVSEPMIEQHEESAMFSLITAIITGVIALVAFIMLHGRRKAAPWFLAVSLLMSAVTAGWMFRTANLGGQIRHTEILSASAASQPEERRASEKKEKDDDDD